MEIFGHEYKFFLTVGASAEIADLCPQGDLSRISEALNAPYGTRVSFVSGLIAALAKGYDEAARFRGEDVTHPTLTAAMLKALPSEAFNEAQREALDAFSGGMKQTVEVAPSKKKENVTGESS